MKESCDEGRYEAKVGPGDGHGFGWRFLHDRPTIPLGVASGVLYVSVVLVCLWSPGRNDIILIAALCSGLTLLGYWGSPEGGEFWKVVANRLLTIFAIGSVAILGYTMRRGSDVEIQAVLAALKNQKQALDEHSIVAITDPSGKIIYTNDKFCEISKYSQEELAGQDHRIVNSGHHPRAFFAEMWKTIAAGRVWHGEVCNRTKDGALYWLDSTIVPFKDESGHITQYIAIRTDISERVIADKALRESEEKFKSISASAQDAIIMMDGDGNISYWNEASRRIFGYTREEVIGKQLHSAGFIVPKRFREAHYQAWLEFQETGRGSVVDKTIEVVAKRKDGEEFPAECSLSAVMIENQWHGIGILRDITERKRAEDELRKLSVAVAQSPATVVITDTNGTIEYVNPRFTEVTGYTKEEAIGQNPRILKSGKWPKKAYEQLWKTILAGETWRGEFENKKKYGEIYWESASISPVRDGQGKVTHFLAVKEDITERKRREEELRQALLAAESADLAKSEFLANMSHEIRTPMTAILGFAETVAENVVKPENVGAIATIRRNGEFLLGIINDILDLSKVEAGKMTVERIACQPCQIVAEVASLMRVRADAKGLAFNIEYLGAIPETIHNDPTRLRQILINLIGNSIKFTEDGAVRLIVRFVEAAKSDQAGGPTEPYMQFDVVDTGLGMSDEQATILFKPFSQADTSTTRKFGGTGLGLTISKRFAELLGGDVTLVESEVGVGTRFRATVATGSLDGVAMLDDPMSATAVTETSGGVARILPSDLHGRRILLAEDGPDNQRLISFILKKAGADVTVKENGKLALDAALAARDEGNPFNCILMDMQMPVMDGYEATGKLRREGYLGPIIALTAHAMASDREKCINAGCDDYETKPIDRKKLIETIQRNLVAAEAASVTAI